MLHRGQAFEVALDLRIAGVEPADDAVHEVARRNGKTSSLSVSDLQACNNLTSPTTTPAVHQRTTAAAALKRNLQKVDASHLKALFATRKLAYSTSLITIGTSSPKIIYPTKILI